MGRRGQDDLTRRRRLNAGCCPTHGIPLASAGVLYDGSDPTCGIGLKLECPRKDCDFTYEAVEGGKVLKAVFDGRKL